MEIGRDFAAQCFFLPAEDFQKDIFLFLKPQVRKKLKYKQIY